jgi:hypothetical protein
MEKVKAHGSLRKGSAAGLDTHFSYPQGPNCPHSPEARPAAGEAYGRWTGDTAL